MLDTLCLPFQETDLISAYFYLFLLYVPIFIICDLYLCIIFSTNKNISVIIYYIFLTVYKMHMNLQTAA